MAGLTAAVHNLFDLNLPIDKWAAEEGIADQEIRERLYKETGAAFEKKAAEIGPAQMRQVEKMVLLYTLDHLWREHIVNMEHLREVIGLRGYGQRDPLNEYKNESFTMFEGLLDSLRTAVTGQLMHVQVSQAEQPVPQQELPPLQGSHADPRTGVDELGGPQMAAGGGVGLLERPSAAAGTGASALASLLADTKPEPVRARRADAVDPKNPATWGKVSRNEPCPCGSGKKFKHCHGKLD